MVFIVSRMAEKMESFPFSPFLDARMLLVLAGSRTQEVAVCMQTISMCCRRRPLVIPCATLCNVFLLGWSGSVIIYVTKNYFLFE